MSKQNIRIRAYNIRLLHNKSKLKIYSLTYINKHKSFKQFMVTANLEINVIPLTALIYSISLCQGTQQFVIKKFKFCN